MSAWTPAPALHDFLARADRRIKSLAWTEGAAAVLVAFTVLRLTWAAALPFAVAAVVIAALVVAATLRVTQRRRSPGTAALIEQRAPRSQNLIATAAELLDDPARVRPYIGERICNDAARVAATLDLSSLFPAGRAVALFAAGALGLLASVAFTSGGASRANLRAVPLEAVNVRGIDVIVTPPAYSGRASQTFHDPARIDALAGSRIQLTVRATAASVTIETTGGRHALSAAANAFTGDVLADADGFIAVEPHSTDGRAGARRLIGLSVTPDLAPRVRITAPARDLFVETANRTLDVTIDADDDIGMASLTLRYTKVSGAGEQFKFSDGDVPLQITRTSARQWKARGSWPLGALGLTAGDMVVYRGVATDARPGAPPSESDSYIVEVTGPGSIASEGFSVDDQFDRYALSQQMVILKTERLIAKRSTITADSLANESVALAAEQRAVRGLFVFMMGGELSDDASLAGLMQLNEEDEAKAEDDLAAGRLANQGRAALLHAIRAMSAANASLIEKALDKALKDERSALAFLQSAFARTRYILRALTERERLDFSRRMTGELATAARDVRPLAQAVPNPRVASLRRVLANVATLASASEFTQDAGSRASELAQHALQIDPADTALQRVSARLSDAAAAASRGRTVEARGLLDVAATALAAAIRASLPLAPREATALNLDRLDGARTDALRSRTVPR